MQQTDKNSVNSFSKGLVTDLHDNLVPSENWVHARNVTVNSHLGQSLFLQNEPSNKLCISVPYTIIGYIKLLNNKWAVFSTDNVNSEIGIFDETLCTYNKVVNDRCLNFSTKNLIYGKSKENFDCSETVYWTDGLNPKRFLNLNNIPYKFTLEGDNCETKKFTNELDCEELRVDRIINHPNIKATKSLFGNLKNGTYQFAIAYVINNVRVSDFYSLTLPETVHNYMNSGESIDLEISNLDRSFEQFELGVIYHKDLSSEYKSLGFYNINTTRINVSDITRSDVTTLTVNDFIIKQIKYPYADIIESNDQYLFWAGLTSTVELNYQPQAMNIKAKYNIYQVPKDHYKNGGFKVGYERDERYGFAIQWLDDMGQWSPAFHIPGRKAKESELAIASGTNVYETDLTRRKDKVVVRNFEVNNTAGEPVRINMNSNEEEKVVAHGTMGYHESSLNYPNRPDLFGEDACTPIRHHQFPDNIKSPINNFSGTHINILGVAFENIEHPKDSKGNYLKNIVGYRIVRTDRKNDRTVVAKGVMTNVRSYKENNREILYPNYPYNDLREDSFLSSREVRGVANGERNFIPLKDYKRNLFNLYAPHCLFSDISLGNEIKIYNEAVSKVEGYFEHPHQHPKFKLLTQFSLYFALILGALDGFYSTRGKVEVITINNNVINLGSLNNGAGSVTPPQTVNVRSRRERKAVDDALKFTSSASVDSTRRNGLEVVLRSLARAGVFAYFTMQTAQRVLEILYQISPWRDYALQYNSVGKFYEYKTIQNDDRRRYIKHYQYVRDGLNNYKGKTFNNYKRETSVLLELNKEILEPVTVDNSRRTMSEFGICGQINKTVESDSSLYYVGIKRKNSSQYGALDSTKYLDTGYIVTNLNPVRVVGSKDIFYKTDTVFGGDTFINKFAFKRSHHFFSQQLHNVPDGFIYNYKLFRNVGFPRYFVDTTPFDMSNFVLRIPTRQNTPANKHNLDCATQSSDALTTIKDRYFYLTSNAVVEYFVESDYNLDLREWKTEFPDFYTDTNTDLSLLFRNGPTFNIEKFHYDKTFSKELIENFIPSQQYNLFNINNEETCRRYKKNLIIYSQKAQRENRADNWLQYLPLNNYEFPSIFGNLTSIKAIDNQQLMFFFDKSAPYITIGRDEIQLDGSGTKVTIGDGGLFARDPRPISFTDYNYGSNISKNSTLVTQYGLFYPSVKQGRLFKFGQGTEDITLKGMDYWLTNNLPFKILEDFPNFNLINNTLEGVGTNMVFDNDDETLYFSKVDYKLKSSQKDKVIYDPIKKEFKNKSNKAVSVKDENYFENASWTLSYNPKYQMFVSWHDWIPDLTIQPENRFFTTKGNQIWKHNDNYNSFCNFYGKDYPLEIEYVVNNQMQNHILRSIEYYLDYGKYFNNGRDFHQILDGNFDTITISNNEQCSSEMEMVLKSKKDLRQKFEYPKINPTSGRMQTLYSKEENKHRINLFYDLVRDRGEFTKKNLPIWKTDSSGYKKEINSQSIDLDKTPKQRKKFRAFYHKILLKKLVSEDKKLIFKLSTAKENYSFR